MPDWEYGVEVRRHETMTAPATARRHEMKWDPALEEVATYFVKLIQASVMGPLIACLFIGLGMLALAVLIFIGMIIIAVVAILALLVAFCFGIGMPLSALVGRYDWAKKAVTEVVKT